MCRTNKNDTNIKIVVLPCTEPSSAAAHPCRGGSRSGQLGAAPWPRQALKITKVGPIR
jgi:hypothetical protein